MANVSAYKMTDTCGMKIVTRIANMKNYIVYILPLLMLASATPMRGQEVTAQVLPADSTEQAQASVVDSLPPVVLTYPQILRDMPNVGVHQDSLITLLMEEKIAGVERGENERPGYRVQIYSSNHPQRGKSEALQIEQRVKQELNTSVYVIYSSPSWKVRVGDFLEEQQAAEFRDVIKGLFPDLADYTYIVRDQIKVR